MSTKTQANISRMALVVAILVSGCSSVSQKEVHGASNPVAAAPLAGYAGEVRWKPFFDSDGTGGCPKIWNQYVAASSHAAYASTPDSHTAEAVICSAALGAGSKAAAETKALAQCEAGLDRWKVTVVRNCMIAASK